MLNKKDFKRYMKQGLGHCVQTIKSSDDIVKYKEIVLWGCLHNLSFDTQCEGTRSAYVYELASYFCDADYFVFPLIKAFNKIPSHSEWLFMHYCELLQMFAYHGNLDARKALQEKYYELLTALINKRRFNRYDYERDNFERLCILQTSSDNTETFICIANDIGSLFKLNKHYSSADFDWFLINSESKYGKKKLNTILKRESKKSDNIRCFYESYSQFVCEAQKIVEKPRIKPSVENIVNEISKSGKLSAASKRRFMKSADDTEKQKLAECVLQEQDSLKKAELLSAFTMWNENFPLSHQAIIEYTDSTCEMLSDVAFQVLTNCESEAVHKYAYKLLEQRQQISYAIEIILNNYTQEDKDILLSELKNIRVDYSNESKWHAIGSKIFDMYDRKSKLPKDFLIYIYNTTLCSYCREYAVRKLAKHRWLTNEIIEESRYDSNYDIVEYVNRYYPEK